jgi:hypothetical protein
MSASIGMMNLLELRVAHPDRFHRQDWFVREAFMRVLPTDPLPRRPSRLIRLGQVPKSNAGLVPAVDLAHLFLTYPDDPIWASYLWCSDVDSNRQRVYVGGVTEANGRRLEIHRHIHLTMNFGVPSFA